MLRTTQTMIRLRRLPLLTTPPTTTTTLHHYPILLRRFATTTPPPSSPSPSSSAPLPPPPPPSSSSANKNNNYQKHEIPKKKKRSILWRILKAFLTASFTGGVAFGLYTVYAVKKTRRSLWFLDQPREVEEELSKYAGFPIVDVMQHISHIYLACAMAAKIPGFNHTNITEPLQYLTTKYPDLVIPHSMEAVYRAMFAEDDAKNYERAVEARARAREAAKRNPELNKHWMHWIPTDAQLKREGWEPELVEVVPKTIWAYNTPFQPTPRHIPFELQASIIRLPDGSLAILNPGIITQQQADKMIKGVGGGHVSTIVATCASHGIAITKLHSIFPDAKLIGVDPDHKHEHPELPWSGFLKDDEQMFGPDFQHTTAKGHRTMETIVYHKPTKTLLGLVDTMMPVRGRGLEAYSFVLGLWKGPYTKNRVAVQSPYPWWLVSDSKEYQKAAQAVRALDIETFVLGHGGIFKGKQDVEELKKALDWAANPEKNVPTPQRIAFGVACLWNMGLFSLGPKALWASAFGGKNSSK